MELLGMYLDEHLVLRWLHIIAMAYWLGGEWGVFNSSRLLVDDKLSLEERKRHMESAYRIDILPRTGIVFLLPLGLHLGHNMGVQPLGGAWLVGMWIFVAFWVALVITAFFSRKSPHYMLLTKIDESIRYVVIPALFCVSVYSLIYGEPFSAGWYATKTTIFSGLLIIGLLLRYIMRDWIVIFKQLEAGGPKAELEGKLKSAMSLGRKLAYVYWVGIITNAFLGAVKPF